ncbi:hypothetical protein [Francisella sp. TX07-6608]|uniref:hypothetical protein n=1 Tax=Francisella sp. TX07-6608 TaxID=573568 RepID=UPI0008F9A5FA|nr:hypothetical protein [Francisella sp. TX07-6608]OIN83564.1 smr domain protein [Francisella sp. TX07-6608]
MFIANQLLHKLSFISFKDCQSFFQIIISPDNRTYNIFIKAANKYGRFADVQQAFTEAKNYKLANVVIYNSFIDVLMNSNLTKIKKIEETNRLAQQHIYPNIDKGYERGIIDLHGQNESTTVLILRHYLKEKHSADQQKTITFITGKGIHSKDNESIVRNTFLRFCKENKIKYIQVYN